MMHYDNVSISSYGSHQNRNFNVGSHKGSLRSLPRDDRTEEEEHHQGNAKEENGEKVDNKGQMTNGATTTATLPAKHTRTVVIDENNIDTRSISEEDSEAAQVCLTVVIQIQE